MFRRAVAVLLLGCLWAVGLGGCRGPGATVGTSGTVPAASVSATHLGLDPESGLPWVAASALPASALDTLELIRAGGPYPYPRNDDKTFGNNERLLPPHKRGYYREYTVPKPGDNDRGPWRIITGSGGEKYWTADHYASFQRIKENA